MEQHNTTTLTKQRRTITTTQTTAQHDKPNELYNNADRDYDRNDHVHDNVNVDKNNDYICIVNYIN